MERKKGNKKKGKESRKRKKKKKKGRKQSHLSIANQVFFFFTTKMHAVRVHHFGSFHHHPSCENRVMSTTLQNPQSLPQHFLGIQVCNPIMPLKGIRYDWIIVEKLFGH